MFPHSPILVLLFSHFSVWWGNGLWRTRPILHPKKANIKVICAGLQPPHRRGREGSCVQRVSTFLIHNYFAFSLTPSFTTRENEWWHSMKQRCRCCGYRQSDIPHIDLKQRSASAWATLEASRYSSLTWQPISTRHFSWIHVSWEFFTHYPKIFKPHRQPLGLISYRASIIQTN